MQMIQTFQAIFPKQPWRNRRFKVRGICRFDKLNPCWDGRKDDVPGKHWGGGDACGPCTEAALDV
jgi:hypothetical protein